MLENNLERGMDIKLAENDFVMILAKHKGSTWRRLDVRSGKQGKRISNGAYFTTEFGGSKEEDLEDHLKNKEQPFHHAPEIIY